MVGKRGTVEERFWPKVAKGEPNECWLWLATRNNMGYGLLQQQIDGKNGKRLAHRISFEIANGPVSQDACILHRCDTPLCVNPAHLFIGTLQDNVSDMWAKGRAGPQVKPHRYPGGKPPSFQGSAHPKAKLTDDIVREIRKSPESAYAWAKRLGMNRSTIRRAKLGLNWPHIT